MPALRSYVRRAVGNHDVANEIVQEVSVRALTGDGPCEPGRFLAWSRGIARHVIALGWQMRRRAAAETPLEEEELEEHSSSRWDPEQHIEARMSLARAMVDIDSDGMELLVRRYVFEESGKALADEMGQSPAAVRMRLMRLRSMVSARFQQRPARVVGVEANRQETLPSTSDARDSEPCSPPNFVSEGALNAHRPSSSASDRTGLWCSCSSVHSHG
jgi:RNA polymerase sigma factor (sigma-70 family)